MAAGNAWLLHLGLLPCGVRCAQCGTDEVAIVATDGAGTRRGLCDRCAGERGALRALVRGACPPPAPRNPALLLYPPAMERWLDG